jgi:hypothetical protein
MAFSARKLANKLRNPTNSTQERTIPEINSLSNKFKLIILDNDIESKPQEIWF